ncbi:hypothetical protein [Pseudoalteromonas sp. MTN2-4]|uniref:hypothetical protein n=1 Tax=Pseudoalteromonas sp. MTN2-4 TaxID=3056555 RepID=UPI0036F3462B
MHLLKNDKVRPFFRILAVIASIPAWLLVLLSFAELIGGGGSSLGTWLTTISSLAFAIWLIVIGVTGKAPSLLKNICN